jgi:hypothetical protein
MATDETRDDASKYPRPSVPSVVKLFAPHEEMDVCAMVSPEISFDKHEETALQ